MAYTRLEIINLVLNVLGKKSVNDISQAGEFADSIDRVFDLLLPAILDKDDWRFATKVQQLDVLIDTPLPPQWKFILQLPTDYISAVCTYPAVEFDIYEDKLYSNNDDLKLEYRFLVPLIRLPNWFTRYFVYEMAEELSLAVANKPEYGQWFSKKKAEAYERALAANMRSVPTRSMMNFKIDSARAGFFINDNELPTL